jgi:hypothetical protein
MPTPVVARPAVVEGVLDVIVTRVPGGKLTRPPAAGLLGNLFYRVATLAVRKKKRRRRLKSPKRQKVVLTSDVPTTIIPI